METILTVLIFAGAIQGFFLSLVIFNNAHLKNESKFFLLIILLFFSINIILNAIIQNVARSKPDFMLTTGAFQLMLGPMVYFYVKSLTEEGFAHKFADLVHTVPLMLYLAFIILIHIRRELIPILGMLNKIMWGFILIQLSSYIVPVRIMIKRYNEKLMDNFSSTDKINLKWLDSILFSLLLLLAVYFILVVFIMHDLNRAFINRFFSLILSFFIYLFGYKGLMQKNILPENAQDKVKYSKSLLPAEYAGYWKKKLISCLEEEKPFLDEELSLYSLANNLGIPTNQLSQIINNNLKTNFYELINSYRIDEVKRLLTEDMKKNIIDLAFQAGFNSKTVFNTVFKKKTGMTPTAYRNSINFHDH